MTSGPMAEGVCLFVVYHLLIPQFGKSLISVRVKILGSMESSDQQSKLLTSVSELYHLLPHIDLHLLQFQFKDTNKYNSKDIWFWNQSFGDSIFKGLLEEGGKI